MRWTGCDTSEGTWEPEKNLRCDDKQKLFWISVLNSKCPNEDKKIVQTNSVQTSVVPQPNPTITSRVVKKQHRRSSSPFESLLDDTESLSDFEKQLDEEMKRDKEVAAQIDILQTSLVNYNAIISHFCGQTDRFYVRLRKKRRTFQALKERRKKLLLVEKYDVSPLLIRFVFLVIDNTDRFCIRTPVKMNSIQNQKKDQTTLEELVIEVLSSMEESTIQFMELHVTNAGTAHAS